MKFILTAIAAILFYSSISQDKDTILYQNGDLQIYKSKALFGNTLLYSKERDLQEAKKLDGDCAKTVEYIYTPLSLIGEYYTYEQLIIDYGGGECGNTPANSMEILTINVKTRDTLNVLDFVEEKSLVDALKKDTWVRRLGVNPEALASRATLKDILKVMNEHGNDGVGNFFNEYQFVVAGFDKKNGQIAIRLVRKDYMGFSHYSYLQLGMWVTPLSEIKDQVQKGNVFYLGKFKSWMFDN